MRNFTQWTSIAILFFSNHVKASDNTNHDVIFEIPQRRFIQVDLYRLIFDLIQHTDLFGGVELPESLQTKFTPHRPDVILEQANFPFTSVCFDAFIRNIFINNGEYIDEKDNTWEVLRYSHLANIFQGINGAEISNDIFMPVKYSATEISDKIIHQLEYAFKKNNTVHELIVQRMETIPAHTDVQSILDTSTKRSKRKRHCICCD